jgi:hypothetical protein
MMTGAETWDEPEPTVGAQFACEWERVIAGVSNIASV